MKLEIEGLSEFMNAIQDAASGGIRDKMKVWLDAMGMEFLDLIQDEIIRTNTVDTRRLLNSFEKGDRENLWSMEVGGLTLDVGTNLNYASFANDGHTTVNLSSGKDSRWVPGYWSGSRFVYDPGSSEGMLLVQKWVDGTNYWDSAFAMFERIFSKSLDKKLESWMEDELG